MITQKDKIIKIIKPAIAFALLCLLIFEIQRGFSNYPKVILVLTAKQSSVQVFNVGSYWGDFSQFAYFTTISNVIIVLMICASWIFKVKIKSLYKTIATTYITVTFLVFWTMLAPIMIWDQSLYFSFIMFHEHTVPFVISLFWLRESKKDFEFKKGIKNMLAFPIWYLCFATIFYIASGYDVVIYPFLNYRNVFNTGLEVWASALLSIFIIFCIAFAFILIFYLLQKYIVK